MSDPQPVNVEGCLPAPLRNTLDKLAQNDQFLIQLQNYVNQLGDQIKKGGNKYGTAKFGGKKPQYFQDLSNSDNILAYQQRPSFKIELTSGISLSGSDYKGNAKLLAWDNSAYSKSGDVYVVYDILGKFHHSVTGDRGIVTWDAQRSIWIVEEMNSPLLRYGTLSADLTSGGTATVNDPDSSQSVTALGDMIPAAKKLVSGTAVIVGWFPKFNSGVGTWRVISANACAV